MAKNIRVSDDLYSIALLEARLQHRSLAQQVEFWARLGMVAERQGARAPGAFEAAVEATRRLDERDVAEGRRTGDYFHFLTPAMVRDSKPRFSGEYRYD